MNRTYLIVAGTAIFLENFTVLGYAYATGTDIVRVLTVAAVSQLWLILGALVWPRKKGG